VLLYYVAEHGNTESVSFYTNIRYTWNYYLVTVEPDVVRKTIECVRKRVYYKFIRPRTESTKNITSCRLFPTPSTCSTSNKSVTMPVAVSKMGVVIVHDRVKVNGQCCLDILPSQQMLDVIKHVLAREHSRALRAQQSPSAAMRNSRLSFSWAVAHPTAQTWSPLIARCVESYSSMVIKCESTRLKKSSSDWLKSGKAIIQHLSEKMQFLCFRVLPTKQKH